MGVSASSVSVRSFVDQMDETIPCPCVFATQPLFQKESFETAWLFSTAVTRAAGRMMAARNLAGSDEDGTRAGGRDVREPCGRRLMRLGARR